MVSRVDLTFTSRGVRCQGYLYRPAGRMPPLPCVVMAHGFAATREYGLAPFAEAFAGAGYAAFVFDYRHFGASGGEPRQLLVPSRELEDWLSALTFVRGLDEVAPDAIALWGASLAGGLVTLAAARESTVKAIIALCPLMDGPAAAIAVMRYAGARQLLRLGAHATLDMARAAIGLRPHYILAVARPGELAAMSAPDSYEGYTALVPDGPAPVVAARAIAGLLFFRPVREAEKVTCPALLQICRRDTVAPASAAQKAARRMRQAEVRLYDAGHFDVYGGATRDQVIRDQLAFLRKHLGSA